MADTSNSVLFDAPGPKGRRTIRIVNWIAGILFAVVLVFILMRLHNPPDGENQLSWELWKPAVEREAWTDFYLPGLWMTIKATIVAVVGAVVFGLVFGVGRLLPNPLVRGVSAVIVEFCRAVPVLLLMIFFWRWFAFAGLPSPSYWAVVLALVLYNGSVVAELVRSGVGNLPGGQREASLALGLTETQSLMEIEVPQAVYAMLPAAVTQLVVVLKDTALGSIIMYTDLLQESRRLGSMCFNILNAGHGRGDLLHRLLAVVEARRMAALAHAAAHGRAHRGRARGADRRRRPVQRQSDRGGQGARRAAAGRYAAQIPCASPWHQRLDSQLAAHPLRTGI